jgi:hypothetical protein
MADSVQRIADRKRQNAENRRNKEEGKSPKAKGKASGAAVRRNMTQKSVFVGNLALVGGCSKSFLDRIHRMNMGIYSSGRR